MSDAAGTIPTTAIEVVRQYEPNEVAYAVEEVARLESRWPPRLVMALFAEADRDWGYDWEKTEGIVRALDAVARVCPAAGAALMSCNPEGPVARAVDIEEKRQRDAPHISDFPEAVHV